MHYPKYTYLKSSWLSLATRKREYRQNLPINLIFKMSIKEVKRAHPKYIFSEGKYRRRRSYGAGGSHTPKWRRKYAGILAKEQRLEGGCYHIILFRFGSQTLGQAHTYRLFSSHDPVLYLKNLYLKNFKQRKIFLDNPMKDGLNEHDGWATVLQRSL